MAETETMHQVLLAAPEYGATLFRNQVGLGWYGDARISRTAHGLRVVIDNARPLKAGLCNGSSDLIGWTATGRFLAFEIKTRRGKLTEEQARFLKAVNRSGGVGLVLRSVEEFKEGLVQFT